MTPKPFWKLRGDARQAAKRIYCRYWDFVDWCRHRDIFIDAEIDASGKQIVLSRGVRSITLHRDFGPGYIRGVLRELNSPGRHATAVSDTSGIQENV